MCLIYDDDDDVYDGDANNIRAKYSFTTQFIN